MIPLLMLAAAAPAAEPLRLETHLLAEKREAAPDGTPRTVLVAPVRVGPGDGVVVRLSWRNTGARPIAGLVLANPVPRGLLYRGAQDGVAPEVSADGRSFAPLAALRVAAPGGGTRPALPADVTHVRWRLSDPVAAGGGGSVAFAATVR